jgi:DDE superfamily endonuclease
MTISTIPLEPPRIGNCRNSRPEALQYVRSWDDDMFRRQFRICREDFGDLLYKIDPLIRRNEAKARNSSGSSICPEMRLMITLRILAGAKYLDMIWYRVSVDHVQGYVHDCLLAINSVVNNINVPTTEAEWRLESEKFREVLRCKHGSMGDEMLEGICGAGDGFVVQITEPIARDLDGKPSKNYMNRKGFFALLVQAFCGAHTNFWYFCVGWPGATNDITAYKQTSLHKNSTNKNLPTSTPKWVSFLLDEAYSSVGGCHLTPYSHHQLKKAFHQSDDHRRTLYLKMRTFNHVLSSQRITIERAFGQLVRRWGILWCANSCRLKNVSLMVQCCAKLHNICVERWVKNGSRSGFTNYNEVEIIPEHVNVDIATLPTDEDVANRLNNHYRGIGERAANSDLRAKMMERIWRTGLQITCENDLIGLPSIEDGQEEYVEE